MEKRFFARLWANASPLLHIPEQVAECAGISGFRKACVISKNCCSSSGLASVTPRRKSRRDETVRLRCNKFGACFAHHVKATPLLNVLRRSAGCRSRSFRRLTKLRLEHRVLHRVECRSQSKSAKHDKQGRGENMNGSGRHTVG